EKFYASGSGIVNVKLSGTFAMGVKSRLKGGCWQDCLPHLHSRHVDLCDTGAVAGEGHLRFVAAPTGMGMGVLRAVDGIDGIFHPTEGVARLGEIFGQCVAGFAPLRALIARPGKTHLTT